MDLFAPDTIDFLSLPSVRIEERKRLPNSAAIYFVLDADDAIRYIGRAKSLCFRWRNHHKLPAFQKMGHGRIAYLTVTDPILLPEIEKALIVYFAPPMNTLVSQPHVTPEDGHQAVIHIKTTYELRNRILGKLRTRGTTMQSFFIDIMELIDTDEEFLEMLEIKRHGLREQRNLVHA